MPGPYIAEKSSLGEQSTPFGSGQCVGLLGPDGRAGLGELAALGDDPTPGREAAHHEPLVPDRSTTTSVSLAPPSRVM